jgi:hypothetical protein
MTYAHRFEADRFAMRNGSGLRRNDFNDLRAAVRNRSFRYGANPFAFPILRLVGTRCAAAARSSLALLHRVRIAAGQEVGSGKKLRKRAGKSLKRLSRVNLCAGPSDLSAAADFARRLSSQSHRAQSRTLASSLRCCRIRPDCGRILAACFQRSRVPLRDGGPCRQSSRVLARVLIAWHNTLKNIVELL